MLLFLTFCHTSYAQVDYKDDLNNPLSDSEMGMIHSPLNSCFSNFALADSFSRKHDTINASKFFLQIDPYYFLSQHLTPDSIEKFIADKFKITNHAKDKYKTIFKNAYYAKKSEIYNKLKEMADEDQKIRNRQDSCKDSACYAITGQEMIRTDSIHLMIVRKCTQYFVSLQHEIQHILR